MAIELIDELIEDDTWADLANQPEDSDEDFLSHFPGCKTVVEALTKIR